MSPLPDALWMHVSVEFSGMPDKDYLLLIKNSARLNKTLTKQTLAKQTLTQQTSTTQTLTKEDLTKHNFNRQDFKKARL